MSLVSNERKALQNRGKPCGESCNRSGNPFPLERNLWFLGRLWWEGFRGRVQAPWEVMSHIYPGARAGVTLALEHCTRHPHTSTRKGKLHLGPGQVGQVNTQIPEGSWREGRRDHSRKPSWKNGDNRRM